MQISIPTPRLGRSLGLKLLLVCFLVLLMGIPALFIMAISYDRSSRAQEVTREVGERYGGKQNLLGPILVVPYSLVDEKGNTTTRGEYILFAEEGQVRIPDLKTQIRTRSLYKIPTYEAKPHFTAKFKMPEQSPKKFGINVKTGSQIIWEPAKIVVAVSDVRGLQDDVYLTLPDGTKRKFEPATYSADLARVTTGEVQDFVQRKGLQSVGYLQYMQVAAEDLVIAGSTLNVEVDMSLTGSGGLSITPFAQSTKATLIADWPHPGFMGRFAPKEREINDDGFNASWSVPYLARGIAASGPAHTLNLGAMITQGMEVSLVNPVNPYQNVTRALKYAVLFIGLVFLAYFLFEVIVGVRVHAAQYVLIGLAQCIFYLLLLAFAEHVGFTMAFMIAAFATILATAGYAGAVFGARKYSVRAAAVFASVYGLLYVLMRMQDFALMVGALTAFVAIAGTMYLTRNINWYGADRSIEAA